MEAPAIAGNTADPKPRSPWLQALTDEGPIAALLCISAALRAFRLDDAPGHLIGDEVWYIQAARVIAGLPVLLHHLPANAMSGLDPNAEHPALGKLVMAWSSRFMNDHDAACRLPSVVLGTLGVWLMFQIILQLRGTRTQALFGAFVLSFDNLSLIHGRIATLDIYLVTFILIGTLLWLRGYLEMAAVAFAVGALCKTNAMLGLATMLLYDMAMAKGSWKKPSWRGIGRRALAVVLFTAFFLLGLGALDCYCTEFRTPFAHLHHMAEFHSGLKHTGPSSGTESTPFQWWLNTGYFDYFFLDAPNKHILFRSVMSGYVIFMAPLALLYSAQQWWKIKSPLGAFAITSLIGNFGPIFLAWAIFSRTSYIYYMLPVLPAFACALALAAFALPVFVRWGFVLLMLYALAFAYPMRLF